jgi:hypothetical protein
VDKIIPEALSHLSGPIILLVKEADGDEEVRHSFEKDYHDLLCLLHFFL